MYRAGQRPVFIADHGGPRGERRDFRDIEMELCASGRANQTRRNSRRCPEVTAVPDITGYRSRPRLSRRPFAADPSYRCCTSAMSDVASRFGTFTSTLDKNLAKRVQRKWSASRNR